jgi:catechol 2,3-dioxygenase-like lactoylglutathione lyase family enzyme
MTIRLDHTIVPATDKVASAAFFADIFGLTVKPGQGHFAQVQVNESLTLDFADEPEPWGGAGVRPQDGPEPSLRLPCQRGGVRRDLRPGAGQGAPLRQRAL